MPRDDDKNNDSRGRRDRPPGGKGRSGHPRGPEKKFAKRGFAGKDEGERRPYAGKREGAAPRFNRDDRPRGDDRGGEKRPHTPRGDRLNYNRDDRAPRSRDRTSGPGERGDARPAARFQDKKFGDRKPYAPRDGGGDKRPYAPRGEGFRKDGDRSRGDRPYGARPPRDNDRPHGDRPERKFGGDKKFSRGAPDRGPRKDFGSRPDRGNSKPWQKRDASSPDHAGRNSRPPREGARNFQRPRYDKPGNDRGGDERPRFSRPREDRPRAIVRRATVRFVSGRNSTVHGSGPKAAPTGKSTRAVNTARIGRAATTRTTARFLQSAPPSAAAAPIANARPISKSARRVRRA